MSRSIKTRELYFQSLNSVIANNTTGSWSPIVINIPETNPVFRNVIAEVYVDDNATTATSITKRALTFNLGTSESTHLNNAQNLVNSGENISFQHSYDLTNYFTGSWSGTNMGASASFVFNGATAGSSNYGLRLCMTYEYNTNSATQSKTVFIPVEADYTTLPATKTTFGTLPNLTTFLPETDKVINQINFIFESNRNITGTTILSASFEIESSGSHTTSPYIGALATPRLHKYIWSNKNFSTGSIQRFYMWGNGSGFTNFNVMAAIDYQYNPSSSVILNSVRLPFNFKSSANVTTLTPNTTIREKIHYLVNEPGDITPTTSSIVIFNTRSTANGLFNFRFNTSSNYIQNGSQIITNNAGSHTTAYTSSNGFDIRKGNNILDFEFYTGTAIGSTYLGSISGLIYLNYYSGNGDVNHHNKTIINYFEEGNLSVFNTNRRNIYSHSIWIPESSSFYNLNYIGCEYNLIYAPSLAISNYNLLYSSSINEGGGYELYENTADHYDVTEIGNRKSYSSHNTLFKKYPGDINRPLETTSSRQVVLVNSVGNSQQPTLATYYTYNSINFQVSGSVSGAVGSSTLELYSVSENREIQIKTISGNGAYSFLVPNGEDTYFVIGRNGTTTRSSKTDYPISGSYDIDFSPIITEYETFF